MRILVAAAILCGFSSLSAPAHAADGIQAENLRCEHLVNPVGIDTPQPRLSWTLRATPAE